MSEEKYRIVLELTKEELDDLKYDLNWEKNEGWWLTFDYDIIRKAVKKAEGKKS